MIIILGYYSEIFEIITGILIHTFYTILTSIIILKQRQFIIRLLVVYFHIILQDKLVQ